MESKWRTSETPVPEDAPKIINMEQPPQGAADIANDHLDAMTDTPVSTFCSVNDSDVEEGEKVEETMLGGDVVWVPTNDELEPIFV